MKLLNHINTYQSEADYKNDKSKNFPNVSYIVENDNVLFVKEKTDYSNDYLTFEAIEDGTFTFRGKNSNSLSYSLDGGQTWTALASGSASQTVTAGNKIMWKGTCTPSDTGIGNFSATANFNVQGNIMSLLFGDDFTNKTDLTGKNYAFYSLFYQNTNIKSAKNLILPATTLAEGCYTGMFQGCRNLVTAPTLPATTLANYCYGYMFFSCTGLTTAPELPAETLASGCYQYMFTYCTGLTKAPVLPARTLASGCYQYMFRDCTSITSAPELPATTLASSCYNNMFSGTNVLPDCTNIDFTSKAVLDSGGFIGLFAGTKVTDSDLDRLLPKNTNGKYYLPATTLASSCYQEMFFGCTGLTTAPELPAETLANSCYNGMFADCTSLVNAPSVLPATTLADYCCYYMFSGCTSLTKAPVLPARTLAEGCYSGMFNNCTKLNYIKAMFTTTPGINYTNDWVSSVASTGTFVKNSAATWNVTGLNGIPEGWDVQTASS